MNQKDLAILLAQLTIPDKASARLEQYPTESNIAAAFLWTIFMNKELEDKIIADFGCGHGVLGIGALILGAKKVYFVDLDKHSLDLCKKNISFIATKLETTFDYETVYSDVISFEKQVDIVIQNPPFGVQQEHADKAFLEHAFTLTSLIYSLHTTASGDFLKALSRDYHFIPTLIKIVDFPLKQTMPHHIKQSHNVSVGIWVFRKV